MVINRGFLRLDKHPLLSLLSITFLVLCGLFISNFLALFLQLIYCDFDITRAMSLLSELPDDNNFRTLLMVLQGLISLLSFVIPPLLLLYFSGFSLKTYLNSTDKINFNQLLLTFLITITIMAPNSLIIDWNKNIHFPEFLQSFELWAKQKEAEMERLTLYLVHFSNTTQLIIGIIVFAIIPAFGEELIFRGLVQKEFYRFTRNIHLSIFISAIIFSGIHFQFYGFIPRMLLGALFGYLYYWSGNIWIPISAHFFNNGFTVIVNHLHQIGIIPIDLERADSIPSETIIFISFIFPFLLYYFYKISTNQKSNYAVRLGNDIQ